MEIGNRNHSVILRLSDGLIIPNAPPAPVSSAAPDPKVASLAQQLEKLDADLAKEEENMLSRLRLPLSRTDPAADLASRLKDQEVRGLTTPGSLSVRLSLVTD